MEKLAIFQAPKRHHEASHYEFKSKKPHVDSPSIKRSHPPNESYSLRELSTKPNISSYNKIQQAIVMEAAGRRYDHPDNTIPQKMRCLREILKTLRAMRKEGWIHRDISSANIMIPFEGATGPAGIIIDFDMSRKVDVGDAGGQERTGTVWYMAVDILVNSNKSPIHHVLHDMESVFWVAFLDGLKRSNTVKGELWLETLQQASTMPMIGSHKQAALGSCLDDNIQKYFSEPYSVMRQLLRDWIRRLLREDPKSTSTTLYSVIAGWIPRLFPYKYSTKWIEYTDQHDPEKVFSDVDKLFGRFIAIEEQRSKATTETMRRALEQQYDSELSVVSNVQAVRRSDR